MLLKDKLGHLLSVLFGVKGRFRDQDLAVRDVLDAHARLEGVFPKLVEVVPVGDFTLGDRILDI
jgi:hypothetical protein